MNLRTQSAFRSRTNGDGRTAVILFTGDVKREQRSKGLPPHLLSNLHRQLTRVIDRIPSTDICHVFRDSSGFVLTGPHSRRLLGTRPSLALQIDAAVENCFTDGYERVVLLAGDISIVDDSALRASIQQLRCDHPRFVLGPSRDGGFYLAGFNHPPRIDWNEIPWHSERTALALCTAVESAGFKIIRIDAVDDIDSIHDARRIAALSPLHSIIRSALGSKSSRSNGRTPNLSAILDPSLHQRPPPTLLTV